VTDRKSPNALYERSLTTYDEDDEFDKSLSEGFVGLWGLPLKVVGRLRRSAGTE
jgi:argininosuccinate synthase